MAEPGPDQAAQQRVNFSRLRSEVEAAVMLPEFGAVARRARWRRTRSRATALAVVLLIAGVLGPIGVAADLHATAMNGWVSRPDQQGPTVPQPSTTDGAVAPQVTYEAAAGVDLNHVYVLVDVCVADSCNLQLSRLNSPGGSSGVSGQPLRVNLLRSTPTAWLDSVGLTALSDSVVMVSGLAEGAQWLHQQIDLAATDPPPAMSRPSSATTADRPVQLSRFGRVQVVQARSGRLLDLPSQPPLRHPLVVENLQPSEGIWTTGVTTDGQVGVSVSRDAGQTWTTRSLGVPTTELSAFDDPVFASNDGRVAYVLLRLVNEEFAVFWTSDGGLTWQRQAAPLPWPQPVPVGAPFGMVVRPDGSLLAWLSSSPTVVYLESAGAGTPFRVSSNGPGGPVFAVPDGYVELSTAPGVSRDGASWARAQVPYITPGS